MRLPNFLFRFVAVAKFFKMSSSFAAFSIHRCYVARSPRAAKIRIMTPAAAAVAVTATRLLSTVVPASSARSNHAVRFSSRILGISKASLLPCVLARGTIFPPKIPAAEAFTTTTTCLLAAKPSKHDTTDDTPSSSSSLSNTSSAAKAYQLDGFGVAGGTRVEATTGTGHSISTDIPKSMGGGDTAPQPVETLLGAWMGCTQATASFVGRQLLVERPRNNEPPPVREPTSGRPRRRLPRRTEILLEFDNIEAFRDEKGALELPIRQAPSAPSRLQRITGTIKVSLVHDIDGDDSSTATPAIFLDPEELEVLKEQTEARCPIANMIVESGCAMEVEWIQEKNGR